MTPARPLPLHSVADPALDPAVADYLLASRAPNTHRAYAFDLADFTTWGGSIPSTSDEVARYLAQRAPSLRPSTLRRRLAALASIHRDRGLDDPTKATLVRRVVQGIERCHGTAVHQVAPLLIDDLARIVAAMGTSFAEVRDRAILLVGFFAALRRSEIVALDVNSLTSTGGGLVVTVVRSKTDQAARGRAVHLATRGDALCPVGAVESWLASSGQRDGPLFCPLAQDAQKCARLNSSEIARIVKRRARGIGLSTSRYSGHSLRAGFVTSAAIAGIDVVLIARQTGHRTHQSLAAYARPQVPVQALRIAKASPTPRSDVLRHCDQSG